MYPKSSRFGSRKGSFRQKAAIIAGFSDNGCAKYEANARDGKYKLMFFQELIEKFFDLSYLALDELESLQQKFELEDGSIEPPPYANTVGCFVFWFLSL